MLRKAERPVSKHEAVPSQEYLSRRPRCDLLKMGGNDVCGGFLFVGKSL
jgi:hypothetical protein